MAKRTKRPRTDVSVPPAGLVLHTTVLALDPTALHTHTEAAVDAIYKESESANTLRSYAAALRYWAAWFQLRYRQPLALPVPIPAVVQFIVDHVERLREDGALVHDLPPNLDAALVATGFKAKLGAPKLTTVKHRLAVLSKAHQLQELTNPLRASEVQELLRRVRRAYASRGVRATSKPALVNASLDALLSTCTDGLPGIRDRALLLFGWGSGGRRRSEITKATMENLTRLDAETYVYQLHQTKTRQGGTEQDPNASKPIVGVAAQALTRWLETANISSGAIFRRIRGSVVAGALTPQTVRNIVQRRAALAGLADSGFSAHSLRSGFMTQAGRNQMHLGDAMALSDHRSIAVAMRYFQAGAGTTTGAQALVAGLATVPLPAAKTE